MSLTSATAVFYPAGTRFFCENGHHSATVTHADGLKLGHTTYSRVTFEPGYFGAKACPECEGRLWPDDALFFVETP